MILLILVNIVLMWIWYGLRSKKELQIKDVFLLCQDIDENQGE